MNIFEFIVYQQTNFPVECLSAFPILIGLITAFAIGLWIVMLIHGFPTQKMIYNYTAAENHPERNYIITGKLKDEIAESKLVMQRHRVLMRQFGKWIVEHPKEVLIATIILFVYVLIMGAI